METSSSSIQFSKLEVGQSESDKKKTVSLLALSLQSEGKSGSGIHSPTHHSK